jgi:hypothetical protein
MPGRPPKDAKVPTAQQSVPKPPKVAKEAKPKVVKEKPPKPPKPISEQLLVSLNQRVNEIAKLQGKMMPKARKPRGPLTEEQRARSLIHLQKAREVRNQNKLNSMNNGTVPPSIGV